MLKKAKILKMKAFLLFRLSDVVFVMLVDVLMPTIGGICYCQLIKYSSSICYVLFSFGACVFSLTSVT